MKWLKKLFPKRKPKGLTPAEKHAFWSSVYDNDPPEIAARRFEEASRETA